MVDSEERAKRNTSGVQRKGTAASQPCRCAVSNTTQQAQQQNDAQHDAARPCRVLNSTHAVIRGRFRAHQLVLQLLACRRAPHASTCVRQHTRKLCCASAPTAVLLQVPRLRETRARVPRKSTAKGCNYQRGCAQAREATAATARSRPASALTLAAAGRGQRSHQARRSAGGGVGAGHTAKPRAAHEASAATTDV